MILNYESLIKFLEKKYPGIISEWMAGKKFEQIYMKPKDNGNGFVHAVYEAYKTIYNKHIKDKKIKKIT